MDSAKIENDATSRDKRGRADLENRPVSSRTGKVRGTLDFAPVGEGSQTGVEFHGAASKTVAFSMKVPGPVDYPLGKDGLSRLDALGRDRRQRRVENNDSRPVRRKHEFDMEAVPRGCDR